MINLTRTAQFILGALLGGVIVTAFSPSIPIAILTVVVTGALVTFVGSLTRLLIAQTVLLGPFVLLLSLLVLIPEFRLNALTLGVVTFAIIIAGPVILQVLVGARLGNIPHQRGLEFAAVGLSLATVLAWRFFMPADGLHALNLMYSSEDNAGIIGNLARLLRFGFDYETTQSLGEWSNVFYNVGAALSNGLGSETPTYLLAPLTQWNFIILTFGMVPLTVMLAMTLSKHKMSTAQSLVFFVAATSATALLIWPFTLFGHLSVILAICLLIPTISFLGNRGLRNQLGPLAVFFLAASAYLAANAWFPLIPLSLGILGVTIWFHRDSTGRTIVSLAAVTTILGLAVRGWNIISESSLRSLAASPGATREISIALTILWLVAMMVVAINYSRRPQKKSHPVLWALAVFVLSAVSIWLFGAIVNGGEAGYGGNKFLLAAVCATTPFLLIALAEKVQRKSILATLIVGVVSVFLVVTTQKEIGSLIKSPFIQASPVVDPISTAPVIESIISAIDQDPDAVYCATPTLQPDLGDSLLGYMCSRWAASLRGQDDANAYSWRYALIGTRPPEEILKPIEAASNSNVILIEVGASDPTVRGWWEDLIPESWSRVQSK